jgi:glycosyltransferase involved in cell wall biosynthesis
MTSYSVTIFAHNEESYITQAIESILSQAESKNIYVLVNGSVDKTADLVRQCARNIHVHEYAEPGKSRTWNRFFLQDDLPEYDYYIVMDGDAYLAPDTIKSLVETLESNSDAYIAAALPLNGRKKEFYQKEMIKNHGLFGDCYAVRKNFIQRLKSLKIALPEDLIGDDGLLGALAKIDCMNESHWNDARVVPCVPLSASVPTHKATGITVGFYCHPFEILSVKSWVMQYKRMVNYSVRFYQNKIIRYILSEQNATNLPQYLSALYPDFLPKFKPRTGIYYWLDKYALKKMQSKTTDKF